MSLDEKACFLGDIVPKLVMYKKEDVKQFIKDDWKLIELFFKGDIDFHELIKRRNVLVGKGLI